MSGDWIVRAFISFKRDALDPDPLGVSKHVTRTCGPAYFLLVLLVQNLPFVATRKVSGRRFSPGEWVSLAMSQEPTPIHSGRLSACVPAPCSFSLRSHRCANGGGWVEESGGGWSQSLVASP